MSAPATLSLYLQQAYEAACVMDVRACKPGNVYIGSPGHGMSARDFIHSAQRSAAAIAREPLRLGERIHSAVAATRAALHCNTNLGIVLLCAPLLQARLEHPELSLDEGTRAVLAATTRDDTEALFAAIRLAAPGGLGRRDEHDVHGAARLTLTETMRVAADEDRIARQYADGFEDLFEVLLPYFVAARGRHATLERAVTDLYLATLGLFADSHVRRKHGDAVARRVSEQARALHRRFLAAPEAADTQLELRRFDRELKHASINPGTSADLCVACLLIHRLQTRAFHPVGNPPNDPRGRRPEKGGAPRMTPSP